MTLPHSMDRDFVFNRFSVYFPLPILHFTVKSPSVIPIDQFLKRVLQVEKLKKSVTFFQLAKFELKVTVRCGLWVKCTQL